MMLLSMSRPADCASNVYLVLVCVSFCLQVFEKTGEMDTDGRKQDVLKRRDTDGGSVTSEGRGRLI